MKEISPKELQKAMVLYVEQHGKGQVTLDKLEKIVEKMRKENDK